MTDAPATRSAAPRAATHRRKRCAGLSLVELLIALTILAIGLIGMVTMQTLALRGSEHGKNVSEAAHIADEQMEWLMRQDWTAIPVSPWSAPRVVSGHALGAPNEVPQAYSVIWRVQAGPATALRTIDVQVTWTPPEAPAAAPPRLYAISSTRHDDQ